MKKKILERYNQSADGRFVIDIAAGRVEDLFNDFDTYTPFVRKELATDLADYILDSVRDLGKEPFLIKIRLLNPPDESMKSRIQEGIRNYFQYLKDVEIRDLTRAMRTSVIFFILGIAILFLAVWVGEKIGESTSVVAHVFAEGLTVAAWVSLWEALATFLINWSPYTRQVKMCERIAMADVIFTETP